MNESKNKNTHIYAEVVLHILTEPRRLGRKSKIVFAARQNIDLQFTITNVTYRQHVLFELYGKILYMQEQPYREDDCKNIIKKNTLCRSY